MYMYLLQFIYFINNGIKFFLSIIDLKIFLSKRADFEKLKVRELRTRS